MKYVCLTNIHVSQKSLFFLTNNDLEHIYSLKSHDIARLCEESLKLKNFSASHNTNFVISEHNQHDVGTLKVTFVKLDRRSGSCHHRQSLS